MFLVPLLPEEADGVLENGETEQRLSPEELLLIEMAAEGRSVAQMARASHLSVRTVEYRLAGLRERFQVGSTAELVSQLAKRGF